MKNLDRIPAYDTHKIGVIYVGPNQEDDEVAILRNLYGPSRYMNFLSGLGELIRLRDCSLSEVYTGGLDRNGADGEYAYNWRSEIAQSKLIDQVITLFARFFAVGFSFLEEGGWFCDFVCLYFINSCLFFLYTFCFSFRVCQCVSVYMRASIFVAVYVFNC